MQCDSWRFCKAGATVAIVGRDAAKAKVRLDKIAKDGGKAEFFPCDTTSKTALQKLLTDVLAKFNHVDILVNGAGVNSPTPFFDISEEEFDKIITVNLKGLTLACQIFGRHMVERGSGSIINIGSASGLNPLSRVFTYSASKAAVHNLSKNLAREWAKGIYEAIAWQGISHAKKAKDNKNYPLAPTATLPDCYL